MTTLRPADLLREALAIVLPVACAGCGVDGRALCDRCRAEFVPLVDVRRLSDGTPVHAALRYDGVVRHAILDFKENGRTDVARPLAQPLAAAVRAAALAGTGNGMRLVAIPVRRGAYRRRGYDPLRLLLRRAGLGAPHEVLRSVRARGEQKNLGADQRSENLAGTMNAVRDLAGARVLLVDDVVTTGATLAEAARAIRAAGGEVAGAAVLASTPRLFPRSPLYSRTNP